MEKLPTVRPTSMLEDYSGMEKKPNGRTLQVPTKSGTEVKNLDATNRPYGKNGRRREPSSNSTKNDQLRRPYNAAKGGKCADKRPRPRSQYYGSGKSEAKVDLEDESPEYGSVFVPGTKKQNLNHLLRFTLAPRVSGGAPCSDRFQREKHGNWMATHKHKYNKEQFLQANCQFVVKTDVDYSPYLVDPDMLVDWNLIEQVRLRSTEDVACPICLDTPAAAKMTRCGHVYCWPCILHYLALSDKTWRKCPICYEAVHRKDLKSVVVVSSTSSKVGEEVTLRLMKRERKSWMVVPVSEDDGYRSEAVPLSVNEPNLSIAYSKLLLAPPTEVHNMLTLEKEVLDKMLKETSGEPEACFVEEALQLLSERTRGERKDEAVVDSPIKDREDVVLDGFEDYTVMKDNSEVGTMVNELSGGREGGELVESGEILEASAVKSDGSTMNSLSDDDSETSPNVSPEDVETENQVSGQKPFFFYQAMDGQNIFLTALNLRMLETQYGGLEYCPLTITGLVLEKEAGSMTSELRSRLRSLSHLPVTAAFELLELDMRPLVSPDVLDGYSAPLQARAERRQWRDRQERRREKRITSKVEMQWGRCPAPRIHLDSARHFPRCGEEENSVEPPSPASSSRGGSPVPSAVPGTSDTKLLPIAQTPSESAGPSFAQMLKAGASNGRPRPSVRQADVQIHEDLEEPSSVPRYQHSFSDAIAQALERADLKQDDDNTRKNKKGKKKKPTLLFASGMAFSGK